MADMGRQQKYFAFANRNIENPALVSDLQNHVALLLKKPFLNRIIMKINARIGTPDNHDNHVAVFVQKLIANGRAQLVCVVSHPFLEVEGLQRRMRFHRSFSL